MSVGERRCDGPGIYIPDNRMLGELLAKTYGNRFHPDQACLLLHFIGTKGWLGNIDRNGFAILNAGISGDMAL